MMRNIKMTVRGGHPFVAYMTRNDLPQVLAISAKNHPEVRWSAEGLIEFLRDRSTHAKVVIGYENGGRTVSVLGYMVFVKLRHAVDIWDLTVKESCRRRGVGTMLVEDAVARLGGDRTHVFTEALQDDLGTHLFLQKNGFMCSGTSVPPDDTFPGAYEFARTA